MNRALSLLPIAGSRRVEDYFSENSLAHHWDLSLQQECIEHSDDIILTDDIATRKHVDAIFVVI